MLAAPLYLRVASASFLTSQSTAHTQGCCAPDSSAAQGPFCCWCKSPNLSGDKYQQLYFAHESLKRKTGLQAGSPQVGGQGLYFPPSRAELGVIKVSIPLQAELWAARLPHSTAAGSWGPPLLPTAGQGEGLCPPGQAKLMLYSVITQPCRLHLSVGCNGHRHQTQN